MTGDAVTCDASCTCDWQTDASGAGGALRAIGRLRRHLIEDHGRTNYEAFREAVDGVREQVPE